MDKYPHMLLDLARGERRSFAVLLQDTRRQDMGIMATRVLYASIYASDAYTYLGQPNKGRW